MELFHEKWSQEMNNLTITIITAVDEVKNSLAFIVYFKQSNNNFKISRYK